MAGLAADYATERDVAVESSARQMRELNRGGNFESARYGDSFIHYAGALQLGGRAFQQLVGDVRVVTRLHDQNPGRRHRLDARLADGLPPDDAQPVAFEADDVVIGVRQQDHFVDAEIDQDLRA